MAPTERQLPRGTARQHRCYPLAARVLLLTLCAATAFTRPASATTATVNITTAPTAEQGPAASSRKLLQSANGCPAGWLPAVGTLFDSWPKPRTTECVAYSGCQWAGMFSKVDPGPCGGPCANSRWGAAQRLDGGNGKVCCRFPESVVSNMKMAATWERDTGLLNRRIEVKLAGASNTRTTTVNVLDTCSDKDCNGCCSKNTGKGAWKLIDLEKGPGSALLGFSTSSPTFDINSVKQPGQGGTRPGAPSGVMALCYRDLGAAR